MNDDDTQELRSQWMKYWMAHWAEAGDLPGPKALGSELQQVWDAVHPYTPSDDNALQEGPGVMVSATTSEGCRQPESPEPEQWYSDMIGSGAETSVTEIQSWLLPSQPPPDHSRDEPSPASAPLLSEAWSEQAGPTISIERVKHGRRTNHRREQNRIAQRAYRARKERTILELSEQLLVLRRECEGLKETCEAKDVTARRMTRVAADLSVEVAVLRGRAMVAAVQGGSTSPVQMRRP